jgi:hypothetical protein
MSHGTRTAAVNSGPDACGSGRDPTGGSCEHRKGTLGCTKDRILPLLLLIIIIIIIIIII